jgi:serine/threonine protein kinase, bacterial
MGQRSPQGSTRERIRRRKETVVAFAGWLAREAEPVPGYRLSRPLGRGGWGEVWQATCDGRDWALKFIPCESQQAPQEIRALQAIRQLQHPHLLQIEQIWSVPGYIVIAMELAEGSMLDVLDVYLAESGQPINADHVCFFLMQAAQALDFLNARQHTVNGRRVAFRHCDVKPSNLLVVGQTVKLADFSLAVQTTSTMWYHQRMGTLDYSAPEIFQGWLSDRTDQYALAVSYCHLRSGRLPFPQSPPKFTRDYVRPAPDLTMLSAAERPIIFRALAPVPQDRWPSCTKLIEQLSPCVEEPAVP